MIFFLSAFVLIIGFLFSDDFSYDNNSFYFDEYVSSLLPGGYFYPFFFENYAPDLTYGIEESNGFSIIDNFGAYFEGDSPIYFNWYLNGFKINSSLNPGSSAVLLPLSTSIRFSLKGETDYRAKKGMSFIIKDYKKSGINFSISTVFPNMGSYVSFAPSLLSPHPSERSVKLYETRRKILTNNIINISDHTCFKNSTLSFDFSYYNIKRRFNDFNKYNSTYDERGEIFSFLTDYKRKNNTGSLELIAGLNKRFRDHDFSEFSRLPQETYKKDAFSVFFGTKIEYNGYKIISSFLLEKEKISPNTFDFSKELTDIDGEGFFPFEKFGKFSAATFSLDIGKRIKFKNFVINPFFNIRTSVISGKEKSFSENRINFQNVNYLVLLWYNPFDKYKNLNNNISTGISLDYKPDDTVNIGANLYLKYGYLSFNDKIKNIGILQTGWDIKISLFPGSKNKMFFSFGETPYDLRENLNFFLESQRPFGKYYYSYLMNNNENLYKTTGSFFHFPDKNLKTPYYYRFLSLLSFRISKYFRFNIKTLYKKFKNNFWVKYGEYNGEYKNINGYELYFQNNYPKQYFLTNYDFKKEPFYGELSMQLAAYKKQSWFFSTSFTAHIGMGYTAFGNGPIFNDIGKIDESMADPNTWINGYGRVDGDRAFLGKIFFGFYPFKNFSIGGSIKYRDGDPFAFINYYKSDKNIIFYYKTIQAEDEKGIKGGPREDCVWDFSFKLKYDFNMEKVKGSIYLSVFNLLDLGSELSENVFSEGYRYANELQIPRSIRVGINLNF